MVLRKPFAVVVLPWGVEHANMGGTDATAPPLDVSELLVSVSNNLLVGRNCFGDLLIAGRFRTWPGPARLQKIVSALTVEPGAKTHGQLLGATRANQRSSAVHSDSGRCLAVVLEGAAAD